MGAPKVLFVDDEESVRDIAREFLEQDGFAVRVASSTEDAIRAFEDGVFDAVVTDYKMPGPTGADLARHLKALRPGLPVILLTGFLSSLDRASLTPLFDEILEKPLGVTQMGDAIRRCRSRG